MLPLYNRGKENYYDLVGVRRPGFHLSSHLALLGCELSQNTGPPGGDLLRTEKGLEAPCRALRWLYGEQEDSISLMPVETYLTSTSIARRNQGLEYPEIVL